MIHPKEGGCRLSNIVVGLGFSLIIYFSGKKMSKNIDFFYVRIPQKLQKIFYVHYDYGRIPLHTAIYQTAAILSFAILPLDALYIIFISKMPSIWNEFYIKKVFYVLVATAVYMGICDLFLRVLKKKR